MTSGLEPGPAHRISSLFLSVFASGSMAEKMKWESGLAGLVNICQVTTRIHSQICTSDAVLGVPTQHPLGAQLLEKLQFHHILTF